MAMPKLPSGMTTLGLYEGWEETLETAMVFLHEYESATMTAALRTPSVFTATRRREDSGEDSRADSGPPLAVAGRQLERRVEKRVHRNRARDRERRELLRLREELVELETRHAQLKKARSRTNRDTRLRPQGNDELAAAWQQVAARQEARRRDAQNEKVRLKEKVTERWNVLQCLKRIIERQLAEERNAKVPPPLAAVHVVRSEIVDQLLETSKKMFASTGTWDACPGGSNTTIRMLSPTQLVVEVVDRRLVPFGFRAVADAYWEALVRSKCATFCFFEEEMLVDGRDTMIRGQAFCDDDDEADRDSSIRRQTCVSIQRFLESERAVITNAGQSEFIEVAQQALPGMKIDEQYWHVVEDLTSSSSDASYMTTFGRVMLDFQHEPSYALPLGSVLANYFNSRLGQTFEKTVAAVEDLLLLQTLESKEYNH